MSLEEMKSGQESFDDDENIENEYETGEEGESEQEEESEKESEEESEQEEDPDKEGETDLEKKEAVSFKDHQKILDSQKASSSELESMRAEMASYKQLFEMPKFKKLLSEEINPDNSQELMTEFPKDIKVEDMDEKQLLQMTAEISENRLIQKIEPAFAKMQEQINTLLGNESKKEGDAFFANKKNEFATESKDEITNLTKNGLTYPQAYHAVCGEKIAKSEYQRGLSLNKSKKGKEAHLSSKKTGKTSVKSERMPLDFEDAMRMSGYDV